MKRVYIEREREREREREKERGRENCITDVCSVFPDYINISASSHNLNGYLATPKKANYVLIYLASYYSILRRVFIE